MKGLVFSFTRSLPPGSNSCPRANRYWMAGPVLAEKRDILARLDFERKMAWYGTSKPTVKYDILNFSSKICHVKSKNLLFHISDLT